MLKSVWKSVKPTDCRNSKLVKKESKVIKDIINPQKKEVKKRT